MPFSMSFLKGCIVVLLNNVMITQPIEKVYLLCFPVMAGPYLLYLILLMHTACLAFCEKVFKKIYRLNGTTKSSIILAKT